MCATSTVIGSVHFFCVVVVVVVVVDEVGFFQPFFFYRVVEAILPGLPVKCFNARYTHVFEASRELF